MSEPQPCEDQSEAAPSPEPITVMINASDTAERRAENTWALCNGQGTINPNLVKIFEAYHNLDWQEFQRAYGPATPPEQAPSSPEAA